MPLLLVLLPHSLALLPLPQLLLSLLIHGLLQHLYCCCN
jgi:hypothetical protein